MVFKKHNWSSYGGKGEIIETTIKNRDGRKIDFFKCNDLKDDIMVASILKKKYHRNFSRVETYEEKVRSLKQEAEEETETFKEELSFLEKERKR